MTRLKVGLIGIGGFGKAHVETILNLIDQQRLECVAFAEINPSAYPREFNALTAIGAIHYTDYKEMLLNHPKMDIVVIPTPIPLHKSMCIQAMEHGFHVLLEKPPAVTIQDIHEMIETQDRTGKLCQVNFQNTSGRAFRMCLDQLKDGIIGKLNSVTGVGMALRTKAYYERTSWAGKLVHNGQYVLDGTMNNPFAHLLHNCLVVAGNCDSAHAEPQLVQAECYHANHIEGEDTVSVRIQTGNQVHIHFYSTLCHPDEGIPYIQIEGSNGWMRWSYDNVLIVHHEQGEERYAFEEENLIENMYLNLISTIHNHSKLYSPLYACRSFVLATNGAFESSKQVYPIADLHLHRTAIDNSEAVIIPRIKDVLEEAAVRGKLLSELGLEWAVSTEPFSLDNYQEFKLFRS